MSRLPEWRRMSSGRTFDRPFDSNTFNPIEHHRRPRVHDVLFAVGLGLAGALLLFWGLSK